MTLPDHPLEEEERVSVLRVRHWSLATRMVMLTLLPTLAALVFGGWWLRHEMHASLHAGVAQTLAEKSQRIAARLTLRHDGTVREAASSGDEFSAIFSGWYWQVVQPGGSVLARSRSLWDQPDLRGAKAASESFLQASMGPQQEPLVMKTFAVKLSEDASARPLQLQVFGPAEQMNANLRRIDHILLATGIGLLVLFACLMVVQIRIGLAPLHRLVEIIARLRRPVAGVQPASVQLQQLVVGPDLGALKQELQALVQQNAQIVARARSHAADLNHALKKPLSVLSAAAGRDDAVAALTVLEQSRAMSRLIDRYQARTHSDAIQATLTTAGHEVDVRACVEPLLGMMRQIHSAAELNWCLVWQAPEDEALLWSGDRADLEELLGNLLDNAGKWAASVTRISIARGGANDAELSITVEDDGPGLSASQLAAAGERGLRFDETVEGTGLGLAITQQIAASYAGSLQLDKSPSLKGVRAEVRIAGLMQRQRM